jgi:uncharacterized protein (DUF433 family)
MAAIIMEKVAQVRKILRDLEVQGRWEDAQALRELIKRALATSIIHDKRILGGEPVIEGTRTPVRAVIEYLQLYGSKERVLEALPHLTADQLEAAIAYYEIHPEEVEAHIQAEAELDRELKGDPDATVWEAI